MRIYMNIYRICAYIYHHHVVRLARISLILSLHISLSFIRLRQGLQGYIPYHPIAAVCMFRAGRPAFDWPYAGVHRKHIIYDLVFASPAVSSMSGSSSLYSFRDRW